MSVQEQSQEEGRPEVRLGEAGIATWDVYHVGKFGGTYQGEFEFRCWLDAHRELAADREYRRLLGANPELARKRADDLAFALGQLSQRVLRAPPFWGLGGPMPGAVADHEVVAKVLDAALEAQAAYLRRADERAMAAAKRAADAAAKVLKGEANDADQG